MLTNLFMTFIMPVGNLMWVSVLFMILAIVVWETVWKGLGLWKAAQNKDKVWFVLILLLNTIGILPIIYLYVISKKK